MLYWLPINFEYVILYYHIAQKFDKEKAKQIDCRLGFLGETLREKVNNSRGVFDESLAVCQLYQTFSTIKV